MTAKTYDLYGTKLLDIDQLRVEVERALGIQFRLHDSMYMGGDYFRSGSPPGEEVEIQSNRIDVGDGIEFAESKFPDYPVLLRVSATDRGDAVRERLAAVKALVHLRRSVL